MIYYYKVAASILQQYVEQIMDRTDYKGVSGHVGRIIFKDKNWVRDDVDFPEAVETAEMLAFHKQDWQINEMYCSGHRWITDECLRRIMVGCQNRDADLIGVIITLINQAPWPDIEN